MDIRRIIQTTSFRRTWAVVVFLMAAQVAASGVTPAMGDEMKDRRDSGVIGEKKTTAWVHKPRMTVQPRGSTSVTPEVVGEVAYFGSDSRQSFPGLLGYSFSFNCLGWKYRIQGYWSGGDGTPHPDVTADRVGFWVRLESPDKTTVIQTQEVDVPVTGPLATPPTPEQVEIMQRQGYVEDPFTGEERLLAAQQAVTWLVEKGWAEYRVVADAPLQFTVEQIGDKTFVKTEFEVRDQETQTIKRCVMWALNYWGSRFQSKRSLEAWICYIIGEAPGYASLAARVHMILETFAFSGQIVYADLKNYEKRWSGVKYVK